VRSAFFTDGPARADETHPNGFTLEELRICLAENFSSDGRRAPRCYRAARALRNHRETITHTHPLAAAMHVAAEIPKPHDIQDFPGNPIRPSLRTLRPADDPPEGRVGLGRPLHPQLITRRPNDTETIPARARGAAPQKRRAKIINAEGEFEASERLKDAAVVIEKHPTAL
jgi:hypothetical protein